MIQQVQYCEKKAKKEEPHLPGPFCCVCGQRDSRGRKIRVIESAERKCAPKCDDHGGVKDTFDLSINVPEVRKESCQMFANGVKDTFDLSINVPEVRKES